MPHGPLKVLDVPDVYTLAAAAGEGTAVQLARQNGIAETDQTVTSSLTYAQLWLFFTLL